MAKKIGNYEPANRLKLVKKAAVPNVEKVYSKCGRTFCEVRSCGDCETVLNLRWKYCPMCGSKVIGKIKDARPTVGAEE